jgi:SAM-dependent methyltransferase
VSGPTLPYPPLELANRVGSLEGAADPLEYYDQLGRRTRNEIISRLPADWSFVGKRVLDFGCGAGRTLRHFAAETAEAELWGCDIDEPSIHWMSDNVCPPFRVFANSSEAPLDQPGASFDLIWAISVFTHLTDSWAPWLAELHRLLADGGLLYLTFMGRGMSQLITGEEWDETRIGMNVLRYGQSWDLGGPMVMHAPWWIEAHWGRAFEILSLVPDGFANDSSVGHGSVLMRKRDLSVDAQMLERIDPADARETAALVHSVKQLQGECAGLRHDQARIDASAAEEIRRNKLLEAQIAELNRRLLTLEASKSWAVTRPLRSIAQQARGAWR